MSVLAAGKFRPWIIPVFAACLFAMLSLAILPYPGLQDDEVLFSVPIYVHGRAFYNKRLFGKTIPLMLMGYLGAFKTWVYALVFQLAAPSVWSVRLPMVFAGILTIWLTWQWTRRVAGTRAAAFAIALLATNSVFILTNTFDWGPVAFQHIFLMGGLLAIQIWFQSDSPRNKTKWLVAGFFLWGLGLWDKALMIWPLIGLAVATLCIYPHELRRHLRRTPLVVAAIALLVGSLPLVLYNLARRGETLLSNTKVSFSQLPHKAEELRETVDGSVLFEAMVAVTPGPIQQIPGTSVESLSIAARRFLGAHPRNLLLPAMALALACLILLFRTQVWRVPAFVLIVIAVTWFQMAINTGTGGGAHHVILLWPFPCIFVGIALARVADRGPKLISHTTVTVITILVCANLLNTNEYLADLIRNGALAGWTDASTRLASAIYPYRAGKIGIVDWGYANSLGLMYGRDLKLTLLSDLLRKPAVTEDDRSQLLAMIGAPDFVFIQHTKEQQLFPGVNEQMTAVALALGYEEQIARVVHDNQGRPVFEIVHFVKLPDSLDSQPLPVHLTK